MCEYRLEQGRLVRRTAILIHLQKRGAPGQGPTSGSRAALDPAEQVRRPERGDAVARSGRPGFPRGHELVGFYARRARGPGGGSQRPAAGLPTRGEPPCRSNVERVGSEALPAQDDRVVDGEPVVGLEDVRGGPGGSSMRTTASRSSRRSKVHSMVRRSVANPWRSQKRCTATESYAG